MSLSDSSNVRQVLNLVAIAVNNNPTSLEPWRKVYTEAIDHYEVEMENEENEAKKEELMSDIVTLYIKWADLECSYKQNKSAFSLYDKVTKKTWCQSFSILWMSYLTFLIKSKKYEAAETLFIEAYEKVKVRNLTVVRFMCKNNKR